ncbi:hypothetical protein [Algibacter lectus]|uniref:hypothetical protein n=2 Tax=Algibacter TaxID=261827 RepID=UPI0026F173E4|nr:hypothetical protein [Algibacter lectus]MDO7135443.1 hypothetical protein [Algibacter lectus]
MKKNIKQGVENLPLLYQLSEVEEIGGGEPIQPVVSRRPNRVIKMEVYESVKTPTGAAPKPITKSFNFFK